jgi:ABC-type phosphate/phosphonate transport system substrate-binding protein
VFTKLIESQTGVKGQPVLLSGPEEVRQQLIEGKIQLAVFHGFEYAWAQSKSPELHPLVIAISQNSPKLTAQIIVADGSAVNKLEDLQGKQLAIPSGTREHCRLFVSRRCRSIGHRFDKFFDRITKPNNVGAALDDVAAGRVHATVVDGSAWESYKWARPVEARRLRTLLQSEPFPTGVVVYKQGVLPEPILKKFKDGLSVAHQNVEGKQLMNLWKLTRFDNIPNDYQDTLNNIVKAYPPPIGDE